MECSNKFIDIFEGQEVEAFFQGFINPKFDNLPQNLEAVLSDVKEIWKREGFLTPAELKVNLINKYSGSVDSSFKNLIENIELSRNMGEHVTGYLGKEHAYLSTALAHLYSKETLEPIAMIEIDFSNMGGTNQYFRERLAEERSVSILNIPQHEGEALTDSAARLLASKLIYQLIKRLPTNAKIIPIRSGGDELRILFTGVSDKQELSSLTDRLHATIEEHTAKTALQEHKHLKAPDNPHRNGFGAALTIKNMADIESPNSLIHELDAEIKSWKYILGRLRNGCIDEEFIEMEIKSRIKNGDVSIPEVEDEELFIKKEIIKMKIRAKETAYKLHALNPEGVYSIKNFKDYIFYSLEKIPYNIVVEDDFYSICDLNNLDENDLSEITPMLPLKERRMYLAENYLKETDVNLTEDQKYLLEIAVEDLTSKDPSAKALMPQEMVESINAAEADTYDFKNEFYSESPYVISAFESSGNKSLEDITPYTMGISFHGLAALNDILGHHTADIILKGFAKDVIEDSIGSLGIFAGNESSYDIAHHGGGNFTVLLKPCYLGTDIEPIFISKTVTDRISENIKNYLSEFNRSEIEVFLEGKGLSMDKPLREDLKKRGVTKFCELEDSKERSILVDGKTFNKKINGLHVAVTSQVLSFSSEKNGGEFIGKIRRETDIAMEELRNKLCLDAVIKSKQGKEHRGKFTV